MYRAVVVAEISAEETGFVSGFREGSGKENEGGEGSR